MSINVTKISAPLIDERAPAFFTDSADLNVIAAATGYWPCKRGMIEGVAAGSQLPFRLKSAIDLQAFRPAPKGNLAAPILANDPENGQDYLQFGYGGALARRTLTLGALRLKAGGAGYAVGNTVTLTNGVIITVTGVNAGVITTWTITNYGAFAAQPAAALAQTATNGGGAGAQFLPEMRTNNGSVALSPRNAIVPANAIFSVLAAVRVPIPSPDGMTGVLEPGGTIFGAQLGQAEFSDASNNRWWGLRTNDTGQFMAHFTGDASTLTGVSQPDRRDGEWHVVMITFNPNLGAGSASLWVDGVQIGSIATFTALNPLAGARQLRLGATGLPESGPCGGFAGDIGMLAIVPLDLNLAANAALRQAIGTGLLRRWRGAGDWA